MTHYRFDGKVAVITGAGRGLGRAHALLLASRGAQVVVNDLGGSTQGQGSDTSPAQQVVAHIQAAGGEAVINTDSVNDGEKIIQAALDHFGRVDIVVNNAGILRDVSFGKMTDEDWDAVIEVHLRGAYKVTQAAWNYMREANFGRIIMTSSSSGIYGNFGQANYAAAKLGLYGLVKTLALEGQKYNILANAIAPTAASRMTENLLPPDLLEKIQPDYVSPLVAYLCHESMHETGNLYEVASGWIAKLRWERTQGSRIPLSQATSIEAVAEQWPQINDWTESEHPHSAQDSFAAIMRNVQRGE
jgi:3-hydroxyacyl-CoA dehydrogenase/3a,7a,12a-trihydroxy-5b-cholest-24-enoyl-CoA hydratase